MFRVAETRDDLNVVADQIGNPTSALDIADAIFKVAENLLAFEKARLRGVYYMMGTLVASWAEFAYEMFAASAKGDGATAEVRPIQAAEYPTPAKRPLNSRLNCSRLAVEHTSKQLVPVYDKPIIYYPLSTLIAGFRDILIISIPHDLPHFQRLLSDGSAWGNSLSYAEQPPLDGLAQAYIIGADFVGSDPLCLVLGDNIFYRHGIIDLFTSAAARMDRATVFAYHVQDPERYGVVKFDNTLKAISIEGKPPQPRSLAFTSMIRKLLMSLPTPHLRHEANRKSPMSTGCIWSAASCASSRWVAEMPRLIREPGQPA